MTEELFQKLVSTLASLPGIGKKSAQRISFHLLRLDESSFSRFLENLSDIREKLGYCSVCGAITEHSICEICNSDSRDSKVVCVVEQPEDIFYIEKTGEFRGKYHVLNGVISPLDGIGPENLRIKELMDRIPGAGIEEILLATNPNMEGDATASYLNELLKKEGIRTTRIAHGVTVGSTLEYADQYTLGKAIRSRIQI